MIKKLLLLFYTVRFLKPIQFYWRFYLKINRLLPFSVDIKEPVKVRSINLTPPIVKHSSLNDGQFCFLNEVGVAKLPFDWNSQQMSKLWLYNLHYFEYLNQHQIDRQLAFDLMQDWVNKNPVGVGNGWEPYTLSLRIVNWVKFLSVSDGHDNQLCESLYIQSRFLFKHLEYHLLGNHLFKNGVALLFAGAFFEGKEAQGWLHKGQEIITRQTKEQVLDDGGHFERSPMYHVLILEDILDCLNLDKEGRCFTSMEQDFIRNKAADMLAFLADIVHQDNEIPFFNDSALHVAPSPQAVFNYADALGIKYAKKEGASVINKPDFGMFVLQNQLSKVMFDVGFIGPQYLPGHAHCDTLSYELSLLGKRCIVNSGTFQYAGDERNLFRATQAHNTVQIDALEQHEIWSTFRVARRGYPFDISIAKRADGEVECSAAVSSFRALPGNPFHKRVLNHQENHLIVTDVIEGKGRHVAESFVHLHPDVQVTRVDDHNIACRAGELDFSIEALDGMIFDIQKGWFSAEFGGKAENVVLVLRKQGVSPFSFGYKVCF